MKIAVISGSRADAGPLTKVHEALLAAGHDSRFEVLSFASGLFPEDSRTSIVIRTAIATDQTADHSDADLVVLLGDRYEILGAATAAFLLGKPIAHLSGGDVTEGSQDDSMRHAITKLSHLHFVTNDESRARVIQLGEEPWRVHNVGCPSMDGVEYRKPEPRERKLILVVYHPNTLGETRKEMNHLNTALDFFADNADVVVVGPNKDYGHTQIDYLNKNITYYETVPREVYLDYLANADVLVGNSSSGVYEAPIYGTPVVNIGDRQQGRFMASNILQAEPKSWDIIYQVNKALKMVRQPSRPHGNGDSAKQIADIISSIKDPTQLLRKKFCDIRHEVGGDPQEARLGEVPQRATDQMDFKELQSEFGRTFIGTSPGSWLWAGSGDSFPGK
jgi:UDP-hydrolysing UDP-N-acetyl-D-glucosamine 2-epimerase